MTSSLHGCHGYVDGIAMILYCQDALTNDPQPSPCVRHRKIKSSPGNYRSLEVLLKRAGTMVRAFFGAREPLFACCLA